MSVYFSSIGKSGDQFNMANAVWMQFCTRLVDFGFDMVSHVGDGECDLYCGALEAESAATFATALRLYIAHLESASFPVAASISRQGRGGM